MLAHLERSNFNNLADVKKALARCGIDASVVTPFTHELAAMMSRRHLIVHRADRQDAGGSGKHAAASLGAATVQTWKAAVEGFCQAVIACC